MHQLTTLTSSHCSAEKSGRSRLTPISKLPRAGLFNQIELVSWENWSPPQFQLHCYLQGVFFFWPPLSLAMSQAHYKFLYLGNFRGGQFKLYRAWDLVKLGGGQKKKTPCITPDSQIAGEVCSLNSYLLLPLPQSTFCQTVYTWEKYLLKVPYDKQHTLEKSTFQGILCSTVYTGEKYAFKVQGDFFDWSYLKSQSTRNWLYFVSF